ncbi:DNA-binding domain-containing protein [Microbulbifer halophilus]|uniref:DNA-binding domain-containing protein n=1 Tax=Microbulbifer halophilus TaxID=453963 RepID=A0ABW5EHT6_9GAMM|nr:DNA-binding domain-containing protein [Microbulbifer halophilus]MCW8128382.1 DNA-binding domain-containing protein [Microbulbifer halophilus]
MNALVEQQRSFMARLLDEERMLPADWNGRHAAGLAIYRNNYRTATVEALRSTFERTQRLVGESAFRRAATHHVIVNPPSSWTLDMAGEGFDETCKQLFAKDPEVAEIAWLEWAMHRAFVARDAAPLSAQAFTRICASVVDTNWEDLRLVFAPGLALAPVCHDLSRLWPSLSGAGEEPTILSLETPHHALVWRQGERPVFVLKPDIEAHMLAALENGATWGDTCATLVGELGEDTAVIEAGQMLGHWLSQGLICGIR